MSYRILDIEVTQPLPIITLLPEETGIALIVRRNRKPIGFFMRSLSPLSKISSDQISTWITQECGTRLIQSALQESLAAVEKNRASSVLSQKLPSVTIAICTKDRPEWIVRCVRSLQALHLPKGILGEALASKADNIPANQSNLIPEENYRDANVEILVIDNAPSDQQTEASITAMPGIRYVQEPKAGLNFARNRAIQEARGELVAFIDDDVVVDSGWLMALFCSWVTNSDAGAWTGQVLPYELETEAQILFEQRGGFRRVFEPIRFGTILSSNPFYPSAVGICGTGCNMAFRRDVLLKLNGFDESLDTGKPLPGGGDHDIFYRVVRTGYPLIYEPDCLVFHQHRRAHAQLRHQYWTWGLAIMAFLSKCHQQDPAMRSQVRALMNWWFWDELRQVLYSLRGKHPIPAGMLLAELWGGVQGLFGEYERSQSRSARIRQQHALETSNDKV
jgi:glycosyltransferase involved in cell wall biosynthesis